MRGMSKDWQVRAVLIKTVRKNDMLLSHIGQSNAYVNVRVRASRDFYDLPTTHQMHIISTAGDFVGLYYVNNARF